MCGIVAIKSNKAVAAELLDSLIHLQHRGQDAVGIVTADPQFHFKKGHGLVKEIFADENLEAFKGELGIGHVRYPTAGGYHEEEIQPFFLTNPLGIALAHNGNLTNSKSLAADLSKHNYDFFNTNSDSEILLHLLASALRQSLKEFQQPRSFFQLLCHAVHTVFNKAQGSYSVVCLIANKGILAFRDPHGIRPLVMGQRINQHGGYDTLIASENTMFNHLDFTKLRSIAPGEMVFIDLAGEVHTQQLIKKSFHPCVFEYIYFSRPDATLDDISVYQTRLHLGWQLAKQWQLKYPNTLPDLVIPVPFTSNTAALAFAEMLGVPYREGLYKNPFIGRTFIMRNQKERKRSVKHKLVPQPLEITGKRILLIDDSIVRGTTSKEIINMIKEHAPKAIYFASTCPPIQFPCFYGIDMPSSAELIAANQDIDSIRATLGVDILMYQTQEALLDAMVPLAKREISPCRACLNGQYICGDITKTHQQSLSATRLIEKNEKV